jgi:hypothetical protein
MAHQRHLPALKRVRGYHEFKDRGRTEGVFQRIDDRLKKPVGLRVHLSCGNSDQS